jgi:hypothetical protein
MANIQASLNAVSHRCGVLYIRAQGRRKLEYEIRNKFLRLIQQGQTWISGIGEFMEVLARR